MKPEFDFDDHNGMWGIQDVNGELCRLSYVRDYGKWIIVYYNGAIGWMFSKKEILKYFTACGPPPNKEDYFK